MHKDMIKNKYYNWYYSIIDRAKSDTSRNKKSNYYELHHILPKSMGGNNSKDNLVLLTPKEHFISHILLTKFTIGDSNHKMLTAVIYFKGNSTSYINSRLYEFARNKFSKIQSNRMSGDKNPFYGKTHTPETIQYIKTLNIEYSKTHTNAFYGKTHTPETREKLSIIASNHTKIKCIYCNKLTSPANHSQFHGDNCKFNPNANKEYWDKIHKSSKNFKNDIKLKCNHCERSFGLGMYHRWHGEKCKFNQHVPNN